MSFVSAQLFGSTGFNANGSPVNTDSFGLHPPRVSSTSITEEFQMLDPIVTPNPSPKAEWSATLWHCDQCEAFVSIRSIRTVNEPFCPVCAEVPLDYCGNLGTVPGLDFNEC